MSDENLSATPSVIRPTTDQQMGSWSVYWTLIDGFVACTTCNARQPVTSADSAFKHADGCTAFGHVEIYPWVALHNVLDRERG